MALETQSLEMVLEVREAGASPADDWQELVCAIDDQVEMDNETTTTRTRCGTFSGVQDVEVTLSGNAMANADPDGTEVTYDQVAQWQSSKTLLDYRYYNRAFGAIAAGAVISNQGQARFTNTVASAPDGGVVQFSWTLTPSGTPTIGVPIS